MVIYCNSCCILQPASLYRIALAMFFGADNVDEALKIYPEPSDGEDIRPQISVSDIERNKSLYLGGCESSQCSLLNVSFISSSLH